MGKGLNGIRTRILSKKLKFNEDVYTDVEITILADYESYMIENEPFYQDFSAEFNELRYVFLKQLDSFDEALLIAYMKGMRKVLSYIPASSSDIKYLNISYSYLFFIQFLICEDSKYFYLLDELAESAATNEPLRSSENKPLLQGLVFQNIIYHNKFPKEGLAEVLVNHFKRMTQVCVDAGESAQLVQLYKNFNDSLGFSEITEEDLRYSFHSYIDSNSSFILAEELVEGIVNTDDFYSEKENFILAMTPLLNNVGEENKEIFDQFFSDLGKFDYQKKAKGSFEFFLAEAAKSDIKIVISIRDDRNSISSKVQVLGYDLIPNSIEGILSKVSRSESRIEKQIFLDNQHSQNLLKAYVTLMIYEVCKAIRKRVDINHYGFLNQLSYRELDKLRSKVSEINQFKIYLVGSECLVDLFILHAVDSKKVDDQFSNYMEGLTVAIDQRLHKLSVEGELDQKIIDRFLSELPKNDEVLVQYDYLFSNKVRFSQFSKHVYTSSFAREHAIKSVT
jgi:hypothetical protein